MEIQIGIQIRKKQESSPLIENVKDPSFKLLYSPQCHDPQHGTVKPEASLGNLYLAAALRNNNFEVDVLDCCIGGKNHSMQEAFNNQTALPNGMVRVGLSPETIVKECQGYDVIGISSIFTPQTHMVEDTVILVREAYPEKLIIMGGINARTQLNRYLKAGVDLICLSEAERTIIEIGNTLRQGSLDFSNISGIAFKKDGQIKVNPAVGIIDNLDELPIPARDLLPNERIWEINRPHGGVTKLGDLHKPNAYFSTQTSRGCPYACKFCHISAEVEGSLMGNIGRFRYQSVERVEKEIIAMDELGANYIYIEDDSLLARKKRAWDIFKMLIKYKKRLGDVNGVNLSHLHKNDGSGRLVIDIEMLETMAEAGFNRLSFPVESGSQRIIDKWAAGKINHNRYDIAALIKRANSLGIEVSSCYLIGYPDETYEELVQTLKIAQEHLDAGSMYVNFTMVTPFPGTTLYDYCIENGILLPNIDIADLNWMEPSMKTKIDPWFLKFISRQAYEYINKPERLEIIRSMAPTFTE